MILYSNMRLKIFDREELKRQDSDIIFLIEINGKRWNVYKNKYTIIIKARVGF